jgi:hypothetical protein
MNAAILPRMFVGWTVNIKVFGFIPMFE